MITQNTPERTYFEQATHGDYHMPMQFYHCQIPETFRNLAPHWHDEMEVGFIAEGNATYRMHMETYFVKSGDLVILAPRCLHAIQQNGEEEMKSDSMVFHLNYLGLQSKDNCTMLHLQPLGTKNCIITPVIHPEDPGYEMILDKLRSAMELYQKKTPFYEIRLKAELLLLISELYQYGYIKNEKRSPVQHEAEEKLRSVLTFIKEHYNESIKIHEMAEICGYSDSHFMYFFRNYTGVTALNYLNQYRLEQAAKKLQTTNMPVSQIAMECGWDNISYFNRMFHKMYGVTPGKYRKM